MVGYGLWMGWTHLQAVVHHFQALANLGEVAPESKSSAHREFRKPGRMVLASHLSAWEDQEEEEEQKLKAMLGNLAILCLKMKCKKRSGVVTQW